jgi:hypothetical protein
VRKIVALVAAGAVVLAAQRGSEARQSPAWKQLVGTWRLVGYQFDSDQVDPNRGAHPVGLLHYDVTGHMGVQIMPDRPRAKYAGAVPTGEEARSAILGYTAYFGTYTVDDRAQTVTHHRQGSINPGDVGHDFIRRYEFESSDRLLLKPLDGLPRTLTWERVK